MTGRVIDMSSGSDVTAVTPYQFEGEPVRVVEIDGEAWFVGKDVAERLGYANAADALAKHCKGVAKRYPLLTAGGMQEVRILSEPDVLRLIIGSKLPAAVRFERWVFEEVLPQIRKTGRYSPSAPKTRKPKASPARDARLHAVDREWWNRQMKAAGTSQRKIAKVLGIEHSALSLALAGKRHLRFQEALVLADHLGISVDELRNHLAPRAPEQPAIEAPDDVKTLTRAVASATELLSALLPLLSSKLLAR